MSEDWRAKARAEYQEKRDALSEKQRLLTVELDSLTRQMSTLQQAASALEVQITDLDKAAATFGLLSDQSEDDSQDEGLDGGQGVVVRDVALAALKHAYPRPLRAARIKEIAEEKLGRQLHPKTPGMTLYRLSQAGLVRNKGWDWFFVPQGRGFPQAASD